VGGAAISCSRRSGTMAWCLTLCSTRRVPATSQALRSGGMPTSPCGRPGSPSRQLLRPAVRRILEGQLSCGGARAGEGADDWDSQAALLGEGLEAGSDVETGSTCSTELLAVPAAERTRKDGRLDSESWAARGGAAPQAHELPPLVLRRPGPREQGARGHAGTPGRPAWTTARPGMCLWPTVPVDDIPPYTRRDLGHVDAAMRPTLSPSTTGT